MPSVPEQLRAARESQKLSIHQVADLTKIKSDHIRDLEEGRYEAFSAPIYIRGFVRSYSTVLKLDPKQVLAVLDSELAQNQKFKERPSLLPQKRGWLDVVMLQLSRLKWQVAVPVLLLIMVIGLFVWLSRKWQSHRAKDPVANIGPGLYKPSPAAGDLLPLPPPTNAPPR